MRPFLRDIACAGAAFAALAAAPCSPGSGLPGQTVVGHVVRHDDRAGLAGATVVLLDREMNPVRRTVTDSAGRFVLPTDAPGTYRLLVERPGFASHLSTPLDLPEAGFYEEWLEVRSVPVAGAEAGSGPSAASLTLREDHVVGLCGPAFEPARQGVLVGVVVDELTGRTIPGAKAVAEWEGADAETAGSGARGTGRGRLEFRAREDGYFVYCGIPADTPIRVQALGGGRSGAVVLAQAPPGRVARVDLPLPLSLREDVQPARGGRGSVLGRVVDFGTGEPVVAAEVRLGEDGLTAVTDHNGRFLLDDVPSGSHVVAVHHVTYPHQELILPVQSGSGHDVLIRMVAEAIPLAPLRVTVRSTRWFRNMRGFTERSRTGRGYFFPPEVVRARDPSVLLDLVRTVPGVRVASQPGADRARLTVRGRRCDPTVFVDRTEWRSADPLTALRGSDLEAVEVYRGVTEIPAEFLAPGDPCGAVVVWTRKPRTASS